MNGQGTVIVAVVAVTMMQFAIAEIVKVIAMWHLFVALGLVITGAGTGSTGRGIRTANRDYVFIVVIAMEKMQMSIVQVIKMPLVQNSQMSALLAMNMRVFTAMGSVLHNCVLSITKQTGNIFLLYNQHSTSEKTQPDS